MQKAPILLLRKRAGISLAKEVASLGKPTIGGVDQKSRQKTQPTDERSHTPSLPEDPKESFSITVDPHPSFSLLNQDERVKWRSSLEPLTRHLPLKGGKVKVSLPIKGQEPPNGSAAEATLRIVENQISDGSPPESRGVSLPSHQISWPKPRPLPPKDLLVESSPGFLPAQQSTPAPKPFVELHEKE